MISSNNEVPEITIKGNILKFTLIMLTDTFWAVK